QEHCLGPVCRFSVIAGGRCFLDGCLQSRHVAADRLDLDDLALAVDEGRALPGNPSFSLGGADLLVEAGPVWSIVQGAMSFVMRRTLEDLEGKPALPDSNRKS